MHDTIALRWSLLMTFGTCLLIVPPVMIILLRTNENFCGFEFARRRSKSLANDVLILDRVVSCVVSSVVPSSSTQNDLAFTMDSGKFALSTIKTSVLGGEYTWEQLVSIERRRRSILRRQGKFSFFRIVFFWDGTLLKMLATEPLMWVTMLTYIIVRVFAHLDTLPEALNDIAGADIGVIGVFLSFFLVLFVNDANTTVETIYGISMECKQRVIDVASLAKTTVPREYALRIVRYMNAAVSELMHPSTYHWCLLGMLLISVIILICRSILQDM